MKQGCTGNRNVIVTVADLKFLPAACCALISARDNLPKIDHTKLFLIGVDIASDKILKAKEFFLLRDLDVYIINIYGDELIDKAIYCSNRFPAATYVRLLLNKFIDDSVERLLYIDADTRVMNSLSDLFSEKLASNPLAAVRDIKAYFQDRLSQRNYRLGLPLETDYFNAGVLLFDWQATLEQEILPKAYRFAIKNPDKCRQHDQDALNAVVAGNFKHLDPRWNLTHYYFENGGKKPAWIKHYTGDKPWSRRRKPSSSCDYDWYRGLLEDFPCGDFLERQSFIDRLMVQKRILWRRFGEWGLDSSEVVKITNSWMNTTGHMAE